ncbi:MAG: killer suppression protein [Caldilineaceae bacterium]|nr:killer suppression protein [Caldilineaceae bacterium]
MDVSFESARLAKLLQSQKQMTQKFGAENAKLIKRRLDNLFIASNLEQFGTIVSSLHELKGDRAGTFAIDLRGGLRLIIASADEPAPRKPDGGLDWRAIVAVVVIAVEDYHD